MKRQAGLIYLKRSKKHVLCASECLGMSINQTLRASITNSKEGKKKSIYTWSTFYKTPKQKSKKRTKKKVFCPGAQ